MHVSTNAPLYPLIQSDIWELPAVHHMLAALDECHLARQQNLMVAGEEQSYSLFQLQQAERELSDAKETLLHALEELPLDDSRSAIGILLDLEVAWESNHLQPGVPPTPQWHLLT